LTARGHAVRGTTRRETHLETIERTGAEAVIADPDRVATLVPALAQVAVVCVLLGSAAGTPAELKALHTTRLEMLLTKVVDTTVRGLIYEASGTTDPELLSTGATLVTEFCQRSRIPFALLNADSAADAVERILSG
jgi:uncharacterized protein YbjT (DUF2867 family)